MSFRSVSKFSDVVSRVRSLPPRAQADALEQALSEVDSESLNSADQQDFKLLQLLSRVHTTPSQQPLANACVAALRASGKGLSAGAAMVAALTTLGGNPSSYLLGLAAAQFPDQPSLAYLEAVEQLPFPGGFSGAGMGYARCLRASRDRDGLFPTVRAVLEAAPREAKAEAVRLAAEVVEARLPQPPSEEAVYLAPAPTAAEIARDPERALAQLETRWASFRPRTGAEVEFTQEADRIIIGDSELQIQS